VRGGLRVSVVTYYTSSTDMGIRDVWRMEYRGFKQGGRAFEKGTSESIYLH